jgi:hypothetical protein
MTEPLSTTESLPSSERFNTADQMVALHVRMALSGEALDPKNLDLPEVAAEQLINFDQIVKIAAKGSVLERVNSWEDKWQKITEEDSSLLQLNKEDKAKKIYATWEEEMIQDFKKDSNKHRVDRLKTRNIGGINLDDFNAETVQQIYQRYFTGEKVTISQNGQEKESTPSNLEPFLDDVVAAYNYDYDEIVNDLEALKWYAGIFGTDTEKEQSEQIHADDAIKELIHLKIKLADAAKKQELIDQAKETKTIAGEQKSRHNWLNEKEEPILDWLYQASQLQTKTIPRQAAEPTPKAKIEELEKPPAKPNWEDLKKSGRMLDAELWKNVTQIREIVSNSEVIKKGLPVYYPGAGTDISFALGFTDADNFVFVDFLYVNADGTVNEKHLPDNEIIEIGGKIKSVETEGILGQGGKRIVKFNWGGKERTLTEYAEDATKCTPQELKNGASFVVIKAPTPAGRIGSKEPPGNIMSEQNLARIYRNLSVGGFIHWGPTQSLKPETLGFEELLDKPLSDDRLQPYKYGYPLYQKIKDEPHMLQLLNFDKELATALYIKDGVYTLEINEHTLGYFEDQLKEIKELYIKLPIEKQQEILPTLTTLLIPEEISDEQREQLLEYGKECGLADPQKMQQYFDQAKAVVFKVFPELKTEKTIESTPPEAKSFADILQTTRQKIEAGEAVEVHLDKAGLPSVIENIISAIDLPMGAKIEIISPSKTNIDNQEGKAEIGVRILGQEINLSFNLTNVADNQIAFSKIVSQPEEIYGQNVKTTLEQQKLHERLQKAIQNQLGQQNANIEIETVGLKFSEDNKLVLTIKGKKREK